MYLKLQPYRQGSVVMRKNQKLAAKYYGPYKVLEIIGAVAYKIDLPPGSKVHNIFYVSQLKKKIGHNKVVHTDLPGVNEEGELQVEPVEILDRRLVKRGNSPATMVLIRWSNGDVEEATWEFWDVLSKKFPNFNP